MRFLMLMIPAVYQPGAPDPEKVIQTMDPDRVARMMKLNEDLHAAGALLALDGLHPLSKGARVSYRGGKPVVTDGPFAEARSRTTHLMRKFDQLDRSDRRVLFVRELMVEEQGDLPVIAALRQAVLDRAPQAQAEFLLISPSGVEAPGWRTLRIDDPLKDPWTGTPAIWDAALDQLDYRFERRPGWGEVEAVGN